MLDPKSKIFLLIFGMVFVLVLGFYFYDNKLNKNKAEDSTQETQENISIETYRNMTGLNDGTQYKKGNVIEAQKIINDKVQNIKDTQSYEYFWYKARSLQGKVTLNVVDYSLAREQKNQNFVSIFNDLYKIHEDLKTSYIAGKLTQAQLTTLNSRYFYIFNYLYSNSDKLNFENSDWANTDEYKAFKIKYKDTTVSSAYFNYYLSRESLLPEDNLSIALNMHSIVRLLNFYSDKFSDDNKIFLVSEMKDLIIKYKASKITTLYKEKQYSEVIPARYYAESLAVLSRYDKSIKKEEVVSAFQNTISLIDKYAKGEKDMLYAIKVFVNISLASYLYENDGHKIGPDLVVVLKNIEDITKRFSDSPEVLSIFSNYVKSLVIVKPDTATLNNIAEIIKVDNDFKNFLIKAATGR